MTRNAAVTALSSRAMNCLARLDSKVHEDAKYSFPDDSFCRQFTFKQMSASEALKVKIRLKEMNFMKAKDNRETHDQAVDIEDLSAQDDEASKVKGGIEIKDCLITSYSISGHGGD